jgi:hypothetical protein
LGTTPVKGDRPLFDPLERLFSRPYLAAYSHPVLCGLAGNDICASIDRLASELANLFLRHDHFFTLEMTFEDIAAVYGQRRARGMPQRLTVDDLWILARP